MEGLVKRISIITVNLNNAEGLRRTIDSVQNQSFKDYEFLIIDGDSIDSSMEVLSQRLDANTRYIREKDTGIYNAMNKGIINATGEYLFFLNSGDYLNEPDIIEKCVTYFENFDLIYGDILVKDELNSHHITYPFSLTLKDFYNNSIPHSGGTFIKKRLFDEYGLYDETLKIVSDWKFFLKVIILNNCSTLHLAFPISTFKLDGISSKEKEYMHYERNLVLNELFPKKVLEDYQTYFSADVNYDMEVIFKKVKKYKISSLLLSFLYRVVVLFEKFFPYKK